MSPKKSPPYAALPITLLDDEEYRALLNMPDGAEAFGFYCIILIAGRERLQQGKATRILGTDSLRFENRLTFIEERAGLRPGQAQRCLPVFAAAAGQTDSDPWVTVDLDGRLVIRSFFQEQAQAGTWGGARKGSGRKPKQASQEIKMNQVGNQVGIKLESSWNQDDSRKIKVIQEEIKSPESQAVSPEPVTNSEGMDALDYGLENLKEIKNSSSGLPITITTTITKPAGTGARTREGKPGEPERPVDHGSHQECVEEALELFGDRDAADISRSKAQLSRDLEGPDGAVWWDALAAGLRYADRRRRGPNAIQVDRPIGMAFNKAREWIVLGTIPEDPVPAPVIYSARPRSREPELPEPVPHVAPADSPYRIHNERLGPRWENNPPKQPGAAS